MKRIGGSIMLILNFLLVLHPLQAEEQSVKVGLGAILSGDLAVFGTGDLQAANTYLKYYGRHNIRLIAEDARLTSSEGLRAYRKLISVDKVDVLIAAGTSNGIMAAKGLIHSSHTPTFMASTGGHNIDKAGPWVFRIGNSDTLNGVQQAQYFLEKGIRKVALFTELTEYTTDISKAFRSTFLSRGGKLVYDQSFLPNTADFRSEVTALLKKKPDALFMPTQTGTALGIFLRQLRSQESGSHIQIHTTMVAAPNPDAHRVAGKKILGVYYMDPDYDEKGPKFQEFLAHYKGEYGSRPAAPFHAASVIESLALLQKFLNQGKGYDSERFRLYLEKEVGSTCGYVGCYELDEDGNSNLGFHIARIEKWIQ